MGRKAPEADRGRGAVTKEVGLSTPVTMKELLEAGVHFGHQTRRWNPKMKEFIFGERNGIYIIDLQKTLRLFQEALQYVQDLADQGRTVLFVGTKRQAQEAIAEEAQRCGMPYVTERWLGGLLTNFVTVRKSLDRLKELDSMSSDGRHDPLTKKEIARLEKERGKLEKNLQGVKAMKTLPDAVFIIDTRKESIAVEARSSCSLPGIVELTATRRGDFVIPGNDALRAIRLFAGRIADAVIEGLASRSARGRRPRPRRSREGADAASLRPPRPHRRSAAPQCPGP
jgi:small subunit ribosomal protein S2